MRRIVVASHGKLAEGLMCTGQMIMGDRENLTYVSLLEGDAPEQIAQSVKMEIEAHEEDTFIILADLLGGSVCNQLMKLIQIPNVHVISGMNLCMLLSVCMADESIPIRQLVEQSMEEAKRNIVYFNELWERKEEILND